MRYKREIIIAVSVAVISSAILFVGDRIVDHFDQMSADIEQLEETAAELNVRVEKLLGKVEIWHTPMGGSNATMLAGGEQRRDLDFVKRALVDAYNKILSGNPRGAKTSILLGLDQLGLECHESDDRLICR